MHLTKSFLLLQGHEIQSLYLSVDECGSRVDLDGPKSVRWKLLSGVTGALILIVKVNCV